MMGRFILILMAVLVVSGCATTQQMSSVTELQGQVSSLTSRIEAQDKEIAELKYGVKEVTDRVESKEWEVAETKATTRQLSSTTVVAVEAVSKGAKDIIKVEGVSAERVQRALKNAGVYTGKIDGNLGSKSKAAIVEFQKQHGLRADGVVGKKTWDELKQYLSQ